MSVVPTATTGLTTRQLAEALDLPRRPVKDAWVDHRQVAVMARHLRGPQVLGEYRPARWDDDRFWLVHASPEDRSQYFAVGNAINFRFWSLGERGAVPAVGTIGGERLRGSMYMWRALRRTVAEGTLPVLDADFLADLSMAELDRIFASDDGHNPLAVAADERLANLRDLGQTLTRSWHGRFSEVVASSDGSLVAFARASRTFRAFDDPVQKLTMVNAILHSGSGVHRFDDQPLPAIDYHLLKHALRQGLVRVRGELHRKLTAGVVLSGEEGIALRAVALDAFVELADLAGISGEVLDNAFWLNRANCADREPVCLDPATADRCPFLGACRRATGYGLPLELTRYY
jgi:hypothetical protein